MTGDRSSRGKPSNWAVPFVVAGLAVVGLIFFNNLQLPPVEAQILRETAVPSGEDLIEVDITWSYPEAPELIQNERVRIPAELVENGTVPVWGSIDSGFTLDDPGYKLTAGDYLFALGLGGLLGVVMVFTVRGYGYVQGTGEPGSQPYVNPAEDRGFYWRT